MSIRVLHIDVPPEAADPTASFEVLVLLEVDDARESFRFTVDPLRMPGSPVRLVSGDQAFIDRFRNRSNAIHQVRMLVGQAVQHGPVHLPQLIAA
jgi:hypothetical protein